jgi:PAS domain S-box-containing protein
MKNTDLRANFFSKKTSVEELLGIFDLLADYSFFVKDRDGRFMALNRRGCEYCGVASADEALGKADHDFFPKQRADEYQADDIAVMKSGEPILNRIESAPEGEGSPRLVITSKMPLRDRKGKVVGVAGFSRSVEQLRAAGDSVSTFSKVVEYIHRHYDQRLTSESLAEMAGLSASQYERRFRRAFGCSTRQYLIRVRVEKAAQLLAETELSVSHVALACGFYDHAHFSRAFGRLMSSSPTDFRRACRPTSRRPAEGT